MINVWSSKEPTTKQYSKTFSFFKTEMGDINWGRAEVQTSSGAYNSKSFSVSVSVKLWNRLNVEKKKCPSMGQFEKQSMKLNSAFNLLKLCKCNV